MLSASGFISITAFIAAFFYRSHQCGLNTLGYRPRGMFTALHFFLQLINGNFIQDKLTYIRAWLFPVLSSFSFTGVVLQEATPAIEASVSPASELLLIKFLLCIFVKIECNWIVWFSYCHYFSPPV